MGALSINWSTAAVSEEASGPLLTVELSEAPDIFWCNEFVALTEGRSQKTGEGWFVAAPPMVERRRFGVAGITPDAEHELRDELNAIIEAANAAAVRARGETDERNAAEEAATRDRDRAAREMTERFRSGN
jgi:hypothetical protein